MFKTDISARILKQVFYYMYRIQGCTVYTDRPSIQARFIFLHNKLQSLTIYEQ